MRVYKFVAYSSLAVGLIAAILIASIPFRFPHSSISWYLIIASGMTLIALIALLFLKPIMHLRSFRFLTAVLAVLALTAALTRWLPWFILALFAAALGALFLAQKADLPKV